MAGNLISKLLPKSNNEVDRINGKSGQITELLSADQRVDIKYVDLVIQFIGASGIPKSDLIGSAGPYFVANLDRKVSFISSVISRTPDPIWNYTWRVINIPFTAVLHVEIFDKDKHSPGDSSIGKFQTTITPGTKEAEIEGGMFKRKKGTFWLKIDSSPSSSPHPDAYPYVFDGPIRFQRHFSPTFGKLTNINDARLYSTWTIFLKSVPLFLSRFPLQHWNDKYKAAQMIFNPGPTALAVRCGIRAGHKLLYARSTNNVYGFIETREDVCALFRGGGDRSPDNSAQATHAHRIKPTVYTYVICENDNTLRFSETGAAFFLEFLSKHALHANAAPEVLYSGEFHPRPAIGGPSSSKEEGGGDGGTTEQKPRGWAAFNEGIQDEDVQWELVVDNCSGTYAPDGGELLKEGVKGLMEANFPGWGVVVYEKDDSALEESREACRRYAVETRGVREEDVREDALHREMHENARQRIQEKASGNQTMVENSSNGATNEGAVSSSA